MYKNGLIYKFFMQQQWFSLISFGKKHLVRYQFSQNDEIIMWQSWADI